MNRDDSAASTLKLRPLTVRFLLILTSEFDTKLAKLARSTTMIGFVCHSLPQSTPVSEKRLTQHGSGRRNRAHSFWGRDNELSRRSEGKFCQLWEKTWKGMVWLNTVNFLFRPVVFQNPHIFHSGAGQKRWSRRGGKLAGDWSYQQVLLFYLQ